MRCLICFFVMLYCLLGADSLLAAEPEALAVDGVPNLHRITSGLLCGGAPQEPAGFDALAALGVRTVISVDGAVPAATACALRGMRAVHLPLGYDGITSTQADLIAAAVRDLPGPVFLHCHHGRHRGPAAAVTAAIILGWIPPAEGPPALTTFGIDPHYLGLIATVAAARPHDVLSVPDTELPAAAPVTATVTTMLAIDDRNQVLKRLAAGDWKKQADQEPAQEALLLRELLVELSRTPAAQAWPQAVRTATEAATTLEQNLRAGADPAQAWRALQQSCRDCHDQHRDQL